MFKLVEEFFYLVVLVLVVLLFLAAVGWCLPGAPPRPPMKSPFGAQDQLGL